MEGAVYRPGSLLGADPPPRFTSRGGRADLWLRHGRGAGPAWLPDQSRNAVSAAQRTREAGIPALYGAAKWKIAAKSLPRHGTRTKSIAESQAQGPRALWRTDGRQIVNKRAAFILCASAALAAQPPPSGLTLAQAVENAVRNYPSIRVSQEQINAAASGIQLARTAYLPRIDAMAQVNRATRNNVFGLLLPQSVIPSISGPVLGTNNFGTAWGSAVGTLVTWEPFDFGLRRAGVDVAGAARAQSEAALKRTQYDVAVATADAYLTFAAAPETVRAAQAGVHRAR